MDPIYMLTMCAAGVSTMFTFLICFLYFLYDRKSRLLLMITLLLVSDGLISLNFVVWAFADVFLSGDDDYLCRILLPFLSFGYLLSFGFTILIAQRFRNVNVMHAGHKPWNTPLWVVPLVSLLLTLPIVVLNAISADDAVGELIQPSFHSHIDRDRDYCYYSSKSDSFVVYVMCLQLPTLLTVLYNAYAYHKGTEVLSTSSPAVRHREVRRARKYLMVLLVVWIPNLGVNIYHAFIIPQDRDPYNLITFLVNLASLQGFLNSGVYLWGYKPFRKWFKSLSCSTYLSFILFGNSPEFGVEPSYFVPLKTEGQNAVSNQNHSSRGEQEDTTVWERIASGEKNVRFGLGDEYSEFIEPVYSDENGESETEEDDYLTSEKPKKTMREKLGNWWKRKRNRQSFESVDEEDVKTPLVRSRSNSVNSVESSVDGDQSGESYKKTPPRKSMTRRDRSGSPMLVRVPSAEDKKWKKAPVVFE